MLLNILLGVIIVVCIALVGVILLQRSEGGALGMSGGGPGNFMSARGTGDLLTRTTEILAAAFFILCLAMTLISSHQRSTSAVVERLKLQSNPNVLSQPAAAPPASSAPPVGGFTPSTSPPPTSLTGAPPPAAAPAPASSGPLNPFGPSATVTSAPAKK